MNTHSQNQSGNNMKDSPIKSWFKILGEDTPNSLLKIEHTIKKFSAGEIQVELSEIPWGITDFKVRAFIKDSDGLIALAQIKSILDKQTRSHVDLLLYYLPYSRYDRPMTGQYDAFSLKVFTTMINAMYFSSVTIYDNHSEVGTSLLDHCINTPQTECISILNFVLGGDGITGTGGAFDLTKYDALIIPDAGAAKKCRDVAKKFGIKTVITADKTRDVSTGDITGTEVYGDVTGLNVLIVDDICDGGYTFVKLGELLKQRGAASVHLYTTFGIYSKGVDVFADAIDKAFTLFPWVENIRENNNVLLHPIELFPNMN